MENKLELVQQEHIAWAFFHPEKGFLNRDEIHDGEEWTDHLCDAVMLTDTDDVARLVTQYDGVLVVRVVITPLVAH